MAEPMIARLVRHVSAWCRGSWAPPRGPCRPCADARDWPLQGRLAETHLLRTDAEYRSCKLSGSPGQDRHFAIGSVLGIHLRSPERVKQRELLGCLRSVTGTARRKSRFRIEDTSFPKAGVATLASVKTNAFYSDLASIRRTE